MHQAQHSHHDKCEMNLHLVRDMADRDRSRHIRGSLIILSAGVNKIESVCSDRALLLLCRVVMAHRGVGSECGDRREARSEITFLGFPVILKTLCSFRLRESDLSGVFLHPVQEFCQGNAVL